MWKGTMVCITRTRVLRRVLRLCRKHYVIVRVHLPLLRTWCGYACTCTCGAHVYCTCTYVCSCMYVYMYIFTCTYSTLVVHVIKMATLQETIFLVILLSNFNWAATSCHTLWLCTIPSNFFWTLSVPMMLIRLIVSSYVHEDFFARFLAGSLLFDVSSTVGTSAKTLLSRSILH